MIPTPTPVPPDEPWVRDWLRRTATSRERMLMLLSVREAKVSALQAVEFAAVTAVAAPSTRRSGERVAAMVVNISDQTGKNLQRTRECVHGAVLLHEFHRDEASEGTRLFIGIGPEPICSPRSKTPHGRHLKMCIRVKRRRIPFPLAISALRRCCPIFECCSHHVEEYLPSPFGRLRSCAFRQNGAPSVDRGDISGWGHAMRFCTGGMGTR